MYTNYKAKYVSSLPLKIMMSSSSTRGSAFCTTVKRPHRQSLPAQHPPKRVQPRAARLALRLRLAVEQAHLVHRRRRWWLLRRGAASLRLIHEHHRRLYLGAAERASRVRAEPHVDAVHVENVAAIWQQPHLRLLCHDRQADRALQSLLGGGGLVHELRQGVYDRRIESAVGVLVRRVVGGGWIGVGIGRVGLRGDEAGHEVDSPALLAAILAVFPVEKEEDDEKSDGE